MYYFIIILILISFQKGNSIDYITSYLKGEFIENVSSNDDYLITCVDNFTLSIFLKDTLLIKFDKTLFENHFTQKIDIKMSSYKYDKIYNRVYYQVGKTLIFFEIETKQIGIINIESIDFNGFFPNGNIVFLISSNKLVEYDLTKKLKLNEIAIPEGNIEFCSINHREISMLINNKLYLISDGNIIGEMKISESNIIYFKTIKTNSLNYFVLFQNEIDYFSINIYSVKEKRTINKIELNEFGLVSLSSIDNNIFYSNPNFNLECFNLENQEKKEFEIKCTSTLGTNTIFLYNNERFYYLDSLDLNQVTLGTGLSRLKEIDFINNENLLVYVDSQVYNDLFVMSLTGEVIKKISIKNRNFVFIKDFLYYQGYDRDIYQYSFKDKEIEKIIDNKDEIIETASSLHIHDNILYIIKGKSIEYFNINTQKKQKFDLNYFISSIVNVDENFIYALIVSEKDNEMVNLAKINRLNFEVERNIVNYSRYLSEIKRYFILNDLMYLVYKQNRIHIIDYKQLILVDSIITSFNISEMKFIDNEILLSSDSIIYSLKDYQTNKLYSYIKNYNIKDANLFSGIVSFTIKDNKLFLIDKENIIWSDQIIYSSINNHYDQNESENYYNLNDIEKIEVYDIEGKKLNEYNSMNEYLSLTKNLSELNIIIIYTKNKIYPIKSLR